MAHGMKEGFDQLGFRKYSNQASLGDLGSRTHEWILRVPLRKVFAPNISHPCVTCENFCSRKENLTGKVTGKALGQAGGKAQEMRGGREPQRKARKEEHMLGSPNQKLSAQCPALHGQSTPGLWVPVLSNASTSSPSHTFCF